MAPRVCIASTTSHYAAQLWPYLNWALSLRSAGCDVVWLESLASRRFDAAAREGVGELRELLRPYGLDDAVALIGSEGLEVRSPPAGTLPLEAAQSADLLIDLAYLPAAVVRDFRRSVFVDLDPGQAQIWAAAGDLDIAGHDVYISIGDGVVAPGRPFPDAGFDWHYVPTPVALDAWSVGDPIAGDAPYTTISHWWETGGIQIGDEWVEFSKRVGFEPFLTLPSLTSARLELALGGLEDEDEERRLTELGWRVRNAAEVVPTPDAYRAYVYGSRGELTAAKLPYSILQSGWFNDRSASYLAAGRPAVVQRTLRRSEALLPEGEGLLRFDTVEEAAKALNAVEGDYDHHAAAARRLAVEYFDGRRIATRVLELGLE